MLPRPSMIVDGYFYAVFGCLRVLDDLERIDSEGIEPVCEAGNTAPVFQTWYQHIACLLIPFTLLLPLF